MLRLHGSPCCLQPALVEYGDVDAVDVDVEVDEVVVEVGLGEGVEVEVEVEGVEGPHFISTSPLSNVN